MNTKFSNVIIVSESLKSSFYFLFFSLFMVAWFIMCLSFEAAAINSLNIDYSLNDHNFALFILFYCIPFLPVISLFPVLKEFVIKPVNFGIKNNGKVFFMKTLDRNSIHRTFFSRSHFKIGYFGLCRLYRLNGCIHIPLNPRTIHDNTKVGQLFLVYLILFRGYQLSLKNDVLYKKIIK